MEIKLKWSTPGDLTTSGKDSDMKKKIFTLAITACMLAGCREHAEKIPSGKWNYKLIMNSTEIGTAAVSNSFSGGKYKITTEMKMNIGPVSNAMTQTVTETASFEPVSIEINNKITNNGNIQNIDTKAVFNSGTVEVTSAGVTATAQIEGGFHLDGNYILAEMIRHGFKPGKEISARIYDPSLEPEEAVEIKAVVLGEKDIEINGKKERLIHVGQSIEGFKNIDIYMDKNGIVKKAVIIMLNNRIEMIISE